MIEPPSGSVWHYVALSDPGNAAKIPEAIGHEAVVDVTAAADDYGDRLIREGRVANRRGGDRGLALPGQLLNGRETGARTVHGVPKLVYRHEQGAAK